ncbi:MAG: hypothetical protein OEW75_18350, partial [Cyclobacteriaceae bacterium]|nr:hypothetical protein [Cyclobacteriaceae bacterium]
MSITKIYLILLIQIIGCFHVIGQDLKPQLIIPSGNTGRVDQISFSQDSKYVASSFGSDQIVVWDILLGKITHTFRASGRVTALHFHPKLPWIIASSATGTIHFWKYSGNAASEEIQAHQGAVNTMAISHNGKLLISNGNDALIKVWDIEKREITTTLNKYSEVFGSAVFDFQDDLITLGSTSG